MAKAIQMFAGKSSYGVPEEYAQREDGVWFCRHLAFNGYAMAMTKWLRCNLFLDELIKEDIMEYGWNPLYRVEPGRIRLPNPI